MQTHNNRWKNRRTNSNWFGSLDDVFAPTKQEAAAAWEAKQEEIQQTPDTDTNNRYNGNILISI